MRPDLFKTQNPTPPPCRSSVFVKIPQAVRREIERAVVEFDPPSYQACFREYDVAKYGVSYTAFYMFARKLRERLSDDHLRDLIDKRNPDFHENLPAIVARRITDYIAFNDSGRPLDLQRLLVCYRTALESITRARTAAAEAARAAIEERKRRTPSAPWGRKEDGTPQTHAEFLENLHQAVADVYGIDMKTGQDVVWPTKQDPKPPETTPDAQLDAPQVAQQVAQPDAPNEAPTEIASSGQASTPSEEAE